MKNHVYIIFTIMIASLMIASCGGGSSSSDAGELAVYGGTSSADVIPSAVGYSPTSVSVYIEQVWLGSSADCTDLALAVDKGAGAGYQELTANPAIIDNSVDAGSYNCMAIKMRDILRFTPDTLAVTDLPACSDTQYGHDILKDQGVPEAWYDPELDDVTAASGDYETALDESDIQDIFVFFTTSYSAVGETVTSIALDANELLNPNQVVGLLNPIEVQKDTRTAKLLYFDFSNQVVEENDGFDNFYCTLDAPEVGFK